MNNEEASRLLTPEGRWELLQDWLKANPKNRRKLERWLTLEPEQVYPEAREAIADIISTKYGALAGALARCAPFTEYAREMITNIQTLYKERKALDKERKKDARKSTTRAGKRSLRP